MNPQHFVLTPEQRGPALNVLGTQVTVLAANTATQSFGITLQQGDEGMGPPPHCHDWDESFFILNGVVEFICGDEVHQCAPGTLVYAPRGTVHGFRYGSGGGQILEITGQQAMAAEMFTAIHNEIPAGPPDIPKVIAVAARNGVDFKV